MDVRPKKKCQTCAFVILLYCEHIRFYFLSLKPSLKNIQPELTVDLSVTWLILVPMVASRSQLSGASRLHDGSSRRRPGRAPTQRDYVTYTIPSYHIRTAAGFVLSSIVYYETFIELIVCICDVRGRLWFIFFY